MIANYHTHTWRCNHARGAEEDYVNCALNAGLKLLGFSDHSPYLFPDDYYSTFRMRPEQLDDYVSTVLALRKKYVDRIQIPLGLELEYYPRHFRELVAMLRDYPLDYLILGQHFVDNEYDADIYGLDTDDEKILAKYVSQSCEAMQTGLFTCFAHPDLIHFRGSQRVYRDAMTRLCREAKSCGVPLEFNLLGMTRGRTYPNLRFWELASQEGCDVILGRDAHDPEALLNQEAAEKARKKLKTLGLTPLDWVTLRPIR